MSTTWSSKSSRVRFNSCNILPENAAIPLPSVLYPLHSPKYEISKHPALLRDETNCWRGCYVHVLVEVMWLISLPAHWHLYSNGIEHPYTAVCTHIHFHPRHVFQPHAGRVCTYFQLVEYYRFSQNTQLTHYIAPHTHNSCSAQWGLTRPRWTASVLDWPRSSLNHRQYSLPHNWQPKRWVI